MVGLWGMSDTIGPVAVVPEEPETALIPGARETSEATVQLIDEEVRRIVDNAHDDVSRLLADNRDRLDAQAQALLENETLDEREAHTAAGIDAKREQPTDEPAAAPGGI